MNGAWSIVRKELDRVFSDKKLVFSLFIMPVILIIGIYALIGSLQSSMLDDIDSHVPSIYVQNAPDSFAAVFDAAEFEAEVEYISSTDDTEDIKDSILNGTVDLLVVFDDEFISKIQNYTQGAEIPEVKNYYNPSEDYSNNARNEFVNQVLYSYQQILLAERIGDLDSIVVFNIDTNAEDTIIMDSDKATGKALGMMLPYLITILLFASVMGLGVDAVAGEKERGTLSSMLISPLKRSEIVVGKICSLSILACLSAAVYSVSMIVAMPKMLSSIAGDVEGLTISFSIVQILQLLAIMLVLVFLYVAMIMLAAVLARTSKEANTYVTPLYLIIVVAGMITMFQGSSSPDQMMFLIPVYGSSISIQNILVGELTAAQFGMNMGGSIVLAVILVFLITKAFNSEKIMFNA